MWPFSCNHNWNEVASSYAEPSDKEDISMIRKQIDRSNYISGDIELSKELRTHIAGTTNIEFQCIKCGDHYTAVLVGRRNG